MERAREFRKTLTPQEAKLWGELRLLRGQGFHIRRQAPFRGYFLDFVCFDRRVVIEIDGAQHGDDDQAVHDRIRDAVLKREGFLTVRLWNADIDSGVGAAVDGLVAIMEQRPSRKATRG